MENHHHKFSIVTVVYNCVHNIEKTIISVLNQGFVDYEYIIVDGGSTDGTVDVIKQYQDHLSYWVSEKDNGIYHAMNKGLALAKGAWINFLNSGDEFLNTNVLQDVAHFMDHHKPVDVVYGDIAVAKDGVQFVRAAGLPGNSHRMYFCHQSAFVKTSLMREFQFDESLHLSSDFLFFKQCYYAGKVFIKLDLPLVRYDLNGFSNTQRIKGLRENIQVISRMDRHPQKLLYLARLYFVIFWIYLRRKNL